MIKKSIYCLIMLGVSSSFAESRWSLKTGPVYRHDMKASISGSTIELNRHHETEVIFNMDVSLDSITGDNPTLVHEIENSNPHYQQFYNEENQTHFDRLEYNTCQGSNPTIQYIEYRANGLSWSFTTSTYSTPEGVNPSYYYCQKTNEKPILQQTRTVEVPPEALGSSIISDSTLFSGSGWMIEGAYSLNPSNDLFQLQIGLQGLRGESATLQAATEPGQISSRLTVQGPYVETMETTSIAYRDPLNPDIILNEEHSVEHTEGYVHRTTYYMPLENTVKIDSSTDMYSTWLGFGMNLPLGESFAIGCAPRISAHLVDIDAERDELLVDPASGEVLSSWNESDDAQKFAWGLALALNASFDFNDQWFCAVEVMYDWVVEDVTHQIGPNELTYDLSAFQGAIQAGYRF